MEDDLDRIESGELSYTEYLQNEFSWLEEPYELALDRGWLDSDRPTPAQLEYLDSLADETGMEVPGEVRESKDKTSQWIEKLLDEIDARVQLTDITETEVNGVAVYRFRLYFNESLPDGEYEYLRERGLKYKSGSKDRRPAFQFQRQDRSVVESVRQALMDRYVDGEALDEFEVEVGGDL